MSAARAFWGVLGLWMPVKRVFDRVDAAGIVVFVGPNGSGKSLAAVGSLLGTLAGRVWECYDPAHVHNGAFAEHQRDCQPCQASAWLRARLMWRGAGDGLAPQLFDDDCDLCEAGRSLLWSSSVGERLVYSTVELLDGRHPHPLFRPLEDYRQLLRIEHAEVLFDEVAGISDASDSAAMPVQVVNWLHQLRKRDVRLRVTTPAYSRCSKPIRQVAQLVVDARSYFPEAGQGRLWRPRRAFCFSAFDAFAFEDFTAGGKERLKVEARGFLWRPGHPAEAAYNTLGQVLALGHVTEAGMCMVCGGQRRRPTCACKGGEHEHGQAVEVVETVSASGARTRALKVVSDQTE